MSEIKVLLTLRFNESQIERLRAISPRLSIVQRSIARDTEDPGHLCEGDEEILYGMRPPRDLALVPRLKWVQLHTAGINHLLDHPVWSTSIIVTSSNGVHAVPIGEYVFALVLALARRLPRLARLQERSEWPRDRWALLLGSELQGRTIGIVGYGAIGRHVGRIAKHGFGMRVLAVRRSESPVASGYVEPGVGDPEGRWPDAWFRPEQLLELLAQSDVVVLSLPLTTQTQRLIGEKELRAMRPGALLVNISRGGVVDEPALVRALRENWIAGAALDVFEQEPLPRESALWKLENVLVSPHVAGATPLYDDRAVDLFGENLRRYLTGRELLNVALRERGY